MQIQICVCAICYWELFYSFLSLPLQYNKICNVVERSRKKNGGSSRVASPINSSDPVNVLGEGEDEPIALRSHRDSSYKFV